MSCDTPLNVLPCVVIFAVVTPLTAVALSVAPLKVLPVTAPVTARLPSVPTPVMFVKLPAVRLLFVIPLPVYVLALSLVSREPLRAGRKPAAVV